MNPNHNGFELNWSHDSLEVFAHSVAVDILETVVANGATFVVGQTNSFS